MTTVFGLRHPKVNLGLLVADRQTTSVDNQGLPYGKSLGRKLWKSKDGNYCFGHSGRRDEEIETFFENMAEGKFDIQKILSKNYFPELRKLNIKRMGNKIPDVQQMSGIIMLTRFKDKPQLYTCFPLGSVEERAWTCMGSGDQKINEYMNAIQILGEARDYVEDSDLDSDDVIRVGLEAVRRSQSQDLYSSGLDLMICTPEEIFDHYSNLGDDFGRKLKHIQKKYKGSKK